MTSKRINKAIRERMAGKSIQTPLAPKVSKITEQIAKNAILDEPPVKREYGPKGTAATDAIRRHCLSCSCYQVTEVRLCPIEDCNLYPWRFGKLPETVGQKEAKLAGRAGRERRKSIGNTAGLERFRAAKQRERVEAPS